MKISHELPLGLMHNAYKWNDYDYCLPHLIDQYEQYRIFFQKSRLDKRFIIMDNGLFENVVHTTEDLLEKINLVRPNIFVVPDVWNDSNATLVNAKRDMGELIITYQTLVDLGYTHIAFNHSSIAYQQEYIGMDSLKAAMYGRMEFIRRLVQSGVIRKDIYHHLLGCSLPQEFMSYGDWPFIKSVDTSNPILVGAEGGKYTNSGMTWKPKEKLEHYFEMNLEDKMENIIFNVNKFRSFIKG